MGQLRKFSFSPAFADDEIDLRRVSAESTLVKQSDGILEFFRGDMLLGQGTICDRSACNISVGIAGSGDVAIVLISRI
jgi:hypothetical protein